MQLGDGVKLVICMVGISGCGKTYVANKISRFLKWKGYNARVFSCSDVRKRLYPEYASPPAEYWNEKNEEMKELRLKVITDTLQELFAYLREGGQVGLFDGSNLSRSMREYITKLISNEPNVHLPLWIEMRVNDISIRLRRVQREKLFSIEYMGYDPQQAMKDYENRVQFQMSSYDDLEEEEDPVYCIVEINKDNRKRYITNNVRGYLPTTIVSFVMNLHPEPKPIYFTRHGQSEYNLEDRIGGDPNLTEFGRQYAKHLGKFVASLEKVDVKRLAVWTSCKRRTVQTAMYIDCNSRVRWAALNEIDAGVCENLTYKEMGQRFPELAAQRKCDKLNFRYPQGESYCDIIERLQPVIFELERTTKPVIVVSHQAVLRCLISYFIDTAKEKIPYYSIPLHTLVRIICKEESYDEERYPLMPVNVMESLPRFLETVEEAKKREKQCSF